MDNKKGNKNTPLGVIGLFFSVFELTMSVGFTTTTGVLQWVVAIFAILVVLGVGVMFFLILWNRPQNLYPPSEYPKHLSPQAYTRSLYNPNADKMVQNSSLGSVISFPIETVENESSITPTSTLTSTLNPSSGAVESVVSESDQLLADGKYKEARSAYLKLAENTTDKKSIYESKAQAAYCLGFYDFSNCIDEFEMLLEECSDLIEIYHWYFETFFRLEQYVEAIEILDRAITVINDPDEKDRLRVVKCNALFQKGDLASAETSALELLKVIQKKERKAYIFRVLSEVYSKSERIEDAYVALTNSYNSDPTDYNNVEYIAQFYNNHGEYKKELFYRLEAACLSQNVKSLALLGNCYFSNDMYNLALESYMKANELEEKGSAWVLSNIGNIYNNLGLFALAIEYFTKAQELDPTSQYIMSGLSTAYSNKARQVSEADNILKANKAK